MATVLRSERLVLTLIILPLFRCVCVREREGEGEGEGEGGYMRLAISLEMSDRGGSRSLLDSTTCESAPIEPQGLCQANPVSQRHVCSTHRPCVP